MYHYCLYLKFVMLDFTAQSVNKNAVNSVTRTEIAILRRVTVGRVVNVAGKVQNVSSVRHICCAFHIWKLCKNDTDTVLFNPLICIFFVIVAESKIEWKTGFIGLLGAVLICIFVPSFVLFVRTLKNKVNNNLNSKKISKNMLSFQFH